MESLEPADRQVAAARRLVNNLLDVSRIAAGRLRCELEDVDLAAWSREVASASPTRRARAGCE